MTTRRRKYATPRTEPLLSAAFYPSGRLFATGSADGVVRVWNTSNGAGRGQLRQPFGAPPGARGPVTGLAFTPDGQALVVAAGPRLEVWKFEPFVRLTPADKNPLVPLPANLHRVEVGQAGHLAGVGPMAASGDGRRAAFTGKDGRLRVWDALTFAPVYEGPQSGTPPLALTPSGGVVACGSGAEARVRDLGRNVEVSLRQGGWQNVSALALSADGKQLAVGHSAGFPNQAANLFLWDVAARSARPLRGHQREVSGLAFAGGVLASVSVNDPLVRLWDAASGREFARLRGHADGVRCVAASPDGRRLATGGQDRTVRLWDAAAMREAFLLDGHAGPVTAVAFSPDGRTLASASADKTVKLWDVGSGSPLHSLSYESDVTGVGFGPGGKTLLVRAADGSLDRWDLEPIEALKRRPGPVTPDLDKSPPPEAPDLQPAGTIAAPTALVVSPEKRCALVFTRDRQVLRYSYPDWRLTRAALTREVVLDATLDPAKGLLYAAACEVRQLRTPGPLGWEGVGDVAVFDVAALLDGREGPGLLKPAATVPVGAPLRDLCLVDGGRSLYFLAGRKPGVWQPERIDTEARKPSGTIEMPHTRVSRLRASPDGKSLACLAVRENGPAVHLVAGIEPATAKLTREVDLKATALDMDLGNGGAAVVTCPNDVRLVRPGEGKVEVRPAPFADNSPRLTPDGKRLYVGRRSGGSRVEAFDRNGDGLFDPSRPRDALDGAGELILGFPFWLTPDARFLVGATGRLLRLSAGGVERPTGEPGEPAREGGRLRELPPWREGHAGRVLAVAASPDGLRVLTGGEDRHVLYRAVEDGRPAQKFDVETGSVRGGGLHAATFSPDGRFSVMASWNGLVHGIQTLGLHRVLRKPWGRPAGLDSVAVLPDNNRVAAASDVGLAVWVVRPAGYVSDHNVPTRATLTGVAAHPVTGLIAAGSLDGKIYLFEPTPTGTKERGTLPGHAAECRCVAFSPDGKRLVSAGVDGVVRAWDVEQAKPTADLGGPAAPVMALAVAPDGKLVAAGGLDGALRTWSLETGKPVVESPARPELPIHALAFAPDGKTLYAAAGTVVRRWDVAGHVGPPLTRPTPAPRETPR
ncbi:MAG: hypothetical protein U0797_24135 [Gemmataceae bacterium]